MIRTLKETGIRVPRGFATTAAAYREFHVANVLTATLKAEIDKLNSDEQSIEEAEKILWGENRHNDPGSIAMAG